LLHIRIQLVYPNASKGIGAHTFVAKQKEDKVHKLCKEISEAKATDPTKPAICLKAHRI